MRATTAVVCVLASAAVVLLGASLPASAAAECSDKPLPPENSQIDQYLPSVPDDCGNSEVSRDPDNGGGGDGGGGGGDGGSSQLAPETAQQLEELGPAGQAAAELAVANAPEPAGDGASSGNGADPADAEGASGGPGSTGAQAAQAGEGSPFAALTSALGGGPGDDGGMGFVLPLLLALTAGIGIGYIVWRRRA